MYVCTHTHFDKLLLVCQGFFHFLTPENIPKKMLSLSNYHRTHHHKLHCRSLVSLRSVLSGTSVLSKYTFCAFGQKKPVSTHSWSQKHLIDLFCPCEGRSSPSLIIACNDVFGQFSSARKPFFFLNLALNILEFGDFYSLLEGSFEHGKSVGRRCKCIT